LPFQLGIKDLEKSGRSLRLWWLWLTGRLETGTGSTYSNCRTLLTGSFSSAHLISKLVMAKIPHFEKQNGYMELLQKI
jgi:hypothetical protein